MSRRAERSWVSWRNQGGIDRAYVDLRRWGGRIIALRAPGERWALTRDDVRLAEVLAAQQINEWTKRRAERRERVVHGLPRAVALESYAREHVRAKTADGMVTVGDTWHSLQRAIQFFGAQARLTDITTERVRRWVEQLRTLPGRGGSLLRGGTVRHHLNSVSNLYRRAQSEGYVPPGYNPVAALLDKPRSEPQEAKWLEVPEAALYLEAARHVSRERSPSGRYPFAQAHPLIATFLLTGGREDEVLGLEVGDVDFDQGWVIFRPNDWRRLKTQKSARRVKLWPQLRDILQPYVFGGDSPPARLLFPAYRRGAEVMHQDTRKLLERVLQRAGTVHVVDRGRSRVAQSGDIRTKVFRHTYITARLQTVDGGRQVSTYTVAREVGHSGTDMIERTYGHLAEVRHRAKAVEFRVAQHRKALRQRLKDLNDRPRQAGTLSSRRADA